MTRSEVGGLDDALSYAAPPEIVPLRVFAADSQAVTPSHSKADWQQVSEARLWEELCLCILSSRTRFELASEAVARLKRRGVLRRLRVRPNNVSFSDVVAILRGGGGPKSHQSRSLPFWKTRSHQLVWAARLLFGDGGPRLKPLLYRWSDAVALREYLVKDVPGIGMKQASNFLQTVRFSKDLAVIDTRILAFLRDELMVADVRPSQLGRERYLQLELRMQRLASANGMDMHRLDGIVWSLGAR